MLNFIKTETDGLCISIYFILFYFILIYNLPRLSRNEKLVDSIPSSIDIKARSRYKKLEDLWLAIYGQFDRKNLDNCKRRFF